MPLCELKELEHPLLFVNIANHLFLNKTFLDHNPDLYRLLNLISSRLAHGLLLV